MIEVKAGRALWFVLALLFITALIWQGYEARQTRMATERMAVVEVREELIAVKEKLAVKDGIIRQ